VQGDDEDASPSDRDPFCQHHLSDACCSIFDEWIDDEAQHELHLGSRKNESNGRDKGIKDAALNGQDPAKCITPVANECISEGCQDASYEEDPGSILHCQAVMSRRNLSPIAISLGRGIEHIDGRRPCPASENEDPTRKEERAVVVPG